MPVLTFHLFPRLPTEVRLKIWCYALFLDPRIVEIEWSEESRIWFATRESMPMSPFLEVNFESRLLYLKEYRVLLPQIWHRGDWVAPNKRSPICYFNPDIDAIYLSRSGYDSRIFTTEAIKELASIDCIQNISTIALPMMQCEDFVSTTGSFVRQLLEVIQALVWEVQEFRSALPALKKFIFTVDDEKDKRPVPNKKKWVPKPREVLSFVGEKPQMEGVKQRKLPAEEEVQTYIRKLWKVVLPEDEPPRCNIRAVLRTEEGSMEHH